MYTVSLYVYIHSVYIRGIFLATAIKLFDIETLGPSPT